MLLAGAPEQVCWGRAPSEDQRSASLSGLSLSPLQVDYFKFTRVLQFSRVGGRQLLRDGAVQGPLPPYATGRVLGDGLCLGMSKCVHAF